MKKKGNYIIVQKIQENAKYILNSDLKKNLKSL